VALLWTCSNRSCTSVVLSTHWGTHTLCSPERTPRYCWVQCRDAAAEATAAPLITRKAGRGCGAFRPAPPALIAAPRNYGQGSSAVVGCEVLIGRASKERAGIKEGRLASAVFFCSHFLLSLSNREPLDCKLGLSRAVIHTFCFCR